jgi:hypothetical protein
MNQNERAELIKRIVGDLPFARFTRREASSPEEAKRWEQEGVIVNPSSLEFVVREAERISAEARIFSSLSEEAKLFSSSPASPKPLSGTSSPAPASRTKR